MWHASHTESKQHDNSQDGAFKQISQKVQAVIILESISWLLCGDLDDVNILAATKNGVSPFHLP